MAVIEPNANSVHGSAEGTSRLSFNLHNEWGLSAISRSFHVPVRRERMGLSVGAASLAGGHQLGYGSPQCVSRVKAILLSA